MPLYEYICTACSHEFSEIQRFSDKPIRKCPKCEKLKVEKKISLSGFQLKGGGWYKDGYATKSDGKSGGEKSTPAGSDTKNESKKTDVTAKSEVKESKKTASQK